MRLRSQSGGYKSVYAGTLNSDMHFARHPLANHGTPVAISVQVDGNDAEREAAVVQRLATRPPHPHILIPFAEVLRPQRRYAVSMRGVEEAFNLVIDGAVPEQRTRAIFLQVLSGVREMHRLGMTHADVRRPPAPTNALSGAASRSRPPRHTP